MSLKLHYDFVTQPNLSSINGRGPTLGITRATTATYFDSAGVMQTAATGVARFDHHPVTNVALGILIEGARTNICLHSEDFSNAAWTDVGFPVVVSNAAVAPDGTTTADTIDDNNASAVEGRRQAFTIANDTSAYTVTVHVKKTTGSPTFFPVINARMSGGVGIDDYVVINTTTGAISHSNASSGVNSFVEELSEYWRFGIKIVNTAAGNTSLLASFYPAGNEAFIPNVSSAGVGISTMWGTQVELGSFPTSYIPTVAASVTRNKDDVFKDSLSSELNDAAGTLYVESSQPVLVNGDIVNISSNGALTESQSIYIASDDIAFRGRTGNVDQYNISILNGLTAGVSTKIAAAYADNNFIVYQDGNASSPDTAGSAPTGLARLEVGTGQFIGGYNGHIAEIRYYNTHLQQQLQALSNGIFPVDLSFMGDLVGPLVKDLVQPLVR